MLRAEPVILKASFSRTGAYLDSHIDAVSRLRVGSFDHTPRNALECVDARGQRVVVVTLSLRNILEIIEKSDFILTQF